MAANNSPLIVGLTGGIASGKTLVSDQLAAHGATVIDTDVVARDVVRPGSEGLRRIQARFGSDVINADGSLNRAALRVLVFANVQARKDLEAITHPRIGAAIMEALKTPPEQYFVIVVPLLARSKLRNAVTRVLSVDCDETQQMRRLFARDGGGAATIAGILAAQASRHQKLQMADDVIANTAGLDALTAQVKRIHAFYQNLAGITATQGESG